MNGLSLSVLAGAIAVELSAPQSALAFSPDRQHFFTSCSALNRYDLSADGTHAVKRGTRTLSSSMRPGIDAIFDAWEKFGDSSKERLAYVLATARRESSDTFEPVREAPKCGTNEACRERAIEKLLKERAEKRGKRPRANYALPEKNGLRYYGRGYIQLTTIGNYKTAEARTGLPLVDYPDKALELDVASILLVRGMLEGWHGSRRPLSHYLNDGKLDWISARDNVNPHSPNKPVTAQYAKDFLSCLRVKT